MKRELPARSLRGRELTTRLKWLHRQALYYQVLVVDINAIVMNEIIVFVFFLFCTSVWYFSYHLQFNTDRNLCSRIRASIGIMRLISHREAFVCASRIIFPAFSPSFIYLKSLTDDFADLLPPRSTSPITWRHNGSTVWITCYASHLHTLLHVLYHNNPLLDLRLSLSPGGSILGILHPI